MKHSLKQTLLGSGALASLLLSASLVSCQDEDFGYTSQEIRYAKNFTAKYGNIDPDKSWDMTTAARRAANQHQQDDTQTRAGNMITLDNEGYYEVQRTTLDYMERFLVERRNNLNIGSNFVFKAPSEGSFFIIPIYQGETGFKWSMYMNSNGNKAKIWEQSKGMQAKLPIKNNNQVTGYTDWTNLGWTDNANYSAKQDMPSDWPGYTNGTKMPKIPCWTIGADAVRSMPIEITGKKNQYIHFALCIDDKKDGFDSKGNEENSQWAKIGSYQSSLQNMMLSLEGCPRPTNVNGDVLIIGCEDADLSGSDHDLNDVVFLVVGNPHLPTVIKEKEITQKRYLIEDLGSTVDWDFNDVVVDVSQTEYNEILPSGTKDFNTTVTGSNKIDSRKEQKAKLVHVCGTVPFQLQVGNTFFPLVTDPTNQTQTRRQLVGNTSSTVTQLDSNSGSMWDKQNNPTGWNPNEEKNITGWNPAQNNVHLFVWGTIQTGTYTNTGELAGDGNTYKDVVIEDFTGLTISKVNFPLNGSIPYIIAVDPDIPWMKEGLDIPENWAKKGVTISDPSLNPTNPDNHADTSGSSLYYRYDSNGNVNEIVVWSGVKACVRFSDALDLKSGGNLAALQEALNYTDDNGHKFNTITVKTSNAEAQFALRTEWTNNGQLGGSDYAENLYAHNGEKTIVLSPEQLSAALNGIIIQSRSDNGDIFTEVSLSYTENPKTLTLNVGAGGSVTAKDASGNNERNQFHIATYPNGESVRLVANPDNGYNFVKWTDNNGNPLNSNADCTFQISDNKTINAVFSYRVKASVLPNDAGTIKVDGGNATTSYNSYHEGTTTLVASDPNSGYDFIGWTGTLTSLNKTISVTAASDLYAYYGKEIIAGDQSLSHNEFGGYDLFRCSGSQAQVTRYNTLINTLSDDMNQILIYFTDSNASGTISLKTPGDGNSNYTWTDLPSNANNISINNGVAKYKFSSDDITRIKDSNYFGLTIVTDKDNNLKIKKILVTSKYY